jgi:uncharacterized protein (TIGR03435 family)
MECQMIQGGPEWVDSDRYDVDVAHQRSRGERTARKRNAIWPVSLSLLKDRFQLMIRDGAQEAPIYELRVAESGIVPGGDFILGTS